MWSLLCSWPEVAGGGRLRAAETAWLPVSCRLGLHAQSAPCCWLLAALFLAPPAPMGEEGGWGLSRRRELKVNVCRHNGEGLPPPHEAEARFRSPPPDCLHAAASMINILQRSVWWVQRCRDGRFTESSSQRGFEVFPGIHKESGQPRSRLQRANTTRRPECSFQRPAFAPFCLLDPLSSHAVCSAREMSWRCVQVKASN